MESYLSRDCVDKFGQGPKSHNYNYLSVSLEVENYENGDNNGDNMVTDATDAKAKPGGAHD